MSKHIFKHNQKKPTCLIYNCCILLTVCKYCDGKSVCCLVSISFVFFRLCYLATHLFTGVTLFPFVNLFPGVLQSQGPLYLYQKYYCMYYVYSGLTLVERRLVYLYI